VLLRLIDAQYTRRPFYGSRRMVVYLQQFPLAGIASVGGEQPLVPKMNKHSETVAVCLLRWNGWLSSPSKPTSNTLSHGEGL